MLARTGVNNGLLSQAQADPRIFGGCHWRIRLNFRFTVRGIQPPEVLPDSASGPGVSVPVSPGPGPKSFDVAPFPDFDRPGRNSPVPPLAADSRFRFGRRDRKSSFRCRENREQRVPQACDGVGGSSPNGPGPSTLRPGQLVDVTVQSLLRARSRPRRAARRLAERSGYIAVGDRVPSWTQLQTQFNAAAVQVLSLNETTVPTRQRTC